MKFRGMGLQGKFVMALLLAAALPFLVGLVIFESSGYRHLLAERGKFHQMEAHTLVRALDHASGEQGEILRSWLAADPSLLRHAAECNAALDARPTDVLRKETQSIDQLWHDLPAGDPRLAAVLDNPAADSLKKFRLLHPEAAEILATGKHGTLLAATGKTSDYNQADEEWWRKGAMLDKKGKLIEVLRLDTSSGVFSLDVVLPLHDSNGLAAVVKMSVDVTSLFAKLGFAGETAGERWEIVLPDGWVLASSKPGFNSLDHQVSGDNLEFMRRRGSGWTLMQDERGEERMAGFVALGTPGPLASAFVIFSSRRDDVVGPLQRNFLEIGLAAAALLTTCTLAGFYLIQRNILLPLASLSNAARSISATAGLHTSAHEHGARYTNHRQQAEADLERIKAIQTGDEVETLASDLAVMTSHVLRYQRELETEVAAKTAVIQEDLEMAREFQNALLPSSYPAVTAAGADNMLRLQFAHFYQPAATVGGDFFDLIELDEHRAGILIADVMGHGARSALVTAILRTLVRNRAASVVEPGPFLAELNHHLIEVISRSGQTLFVTAFFMILDTRNCLVSWAVAGHPAPLRVRRGSGRKPEPLWSEPPHQPALGLIEAASYRSVESPLRAGEVFLLHTDGALEAENSEGERFGMERLAASFDEALDGPMAAMPAKIVCDVTAFQHRRNYEDDVCLVVVEAAGVRSNS